MNTQDDVLDIVNLDSFLEKPTQPIEPISGSSYYYVVSHIPYPMSYDTLKKKGIKNERIKAVVNALNWNIQRYNFRDLLKSYEDKEFNMEMKYMDDFQEHLKKIKEQEAKITELEAKLSAIQEVLKPKNEDRETENKEVKQIYSYD